MVTLVSILLGFFLGAGAALWSVWVGLRWAGEMRRQALPSDPGLRRVAAEAGVARPEEDDRVQSMSARILGDWMHGPSER